MESVTEHGHQWTLSRKGLPSTQQHHTKFNENNATLPDVRVVSQFAGQKPLATMREEFTRVAKKAQSRLGSYSTRGAWVRSNSPSRKKQLTWRFVRCI